jgi:hypothetical protein
MTTPDDHPLNLNDVHERYNGAELLAERVAPHLGEGWTAHVDLFKVMLHGPGGEVLRFNSGWARDDKRMLSMTPYAPVDSDGGVTHFGHPRRLNLFLLPSQIAAVIEEDILPAYRKRLAVEQARIAAIQRIEEAQRVTLAKMAARLGDRWDVVEKTYGLKVVCTRKTKRVWGDISFNTIAKQQHGMFLHLRNVPPAVMAQIVDVIAGHINGTDKEVPVWLDPDYDPEFDKHITTDPNDDGAECRDMEGNTYPEHAEIGVGVFAAECRRCGAELDLDDGLQEDNDEH